MAISSDMFLFQVEVRSEQNLFLVELCRGFSAQLGL